MKVIDISVIYATTKDFFFPLSVPLNYAEIRGISLVESGIDRSVSFPGLPETAREDGGDGKKVEESISTKGSVAVLKSGCEHTAEGMQRYRH